MSSGNMSLVFQGSDCSDRKAVNRGPDGSGIGLRLSIGAPWRMVSEADDESEGGRKS